MELIRKFFAVVVTLALVYLLGCLRVEVPKGPFVDVDVGTSNNGGNAAFDEADNDYADQLAIVGLKVRRLADGNKIDAEISGGVKNKGKKTVSYVRVEVVFYDEKSHHVHDKAVTLFDGANLRPGGVRDFSQIYIRHVDRDWKDGGSSVKVKIKKVRVRS